MGLGSRAKRTVVAALAVGGIVAAPSAASATTGVHRTGANPQAVRDYWTPDRIAGAIPLGNLPSSASPLTRGATVGSSKRHKKKSHTRVKHIDRYPNRTNGKVYFSIGQTDYQCSGTSVHSPSKSLVVTAGHCVYEQAPLFGGYVDNWEFIPAFRGGSHEPYGEWPATALRTTNQYEAGNPVGDDGSAFDVGTAIVAPTGDQTLEGTVGSRKAAFNTPARKGHYRPFGYPASPPPREFNGKTLFSCNSPLKTRDGSFNGPPTLGINCDMTGGASGGGWINNGKIVSVTSYGYTNRPGVLFGPYFGNVVKSLLKSVGAR